MQDFEDLKEEVRNETKGKSTLDQIINHELSISDVIGNIEAPPHLEQEYGKLQQSTNDIEKFKKTYFGEEDKEVEQKVEGLIPKMLQRMKTKYIGGKEKKIVKGEKGIFEVAKEIEEHAKDDLRQIEEGIPDLKRNINTIDKYNKQNKDKMMECEFIYERCNEKEHRIDELCKEIDIRKKYENLSALEKKELNTLENNLQETKSNIYITKKSVAKNIVNYDQITRRQEQVINNFKQGYQETLSNISTAKNVISCFSIEIEMAKPSMMMIEYSSKLDQMFSGITNHMKVMSKFNMETLVKMGDITSKGGEWHLYDENDITELGLQSKDYKQTLEERDDRLFGKVDDILKKSKYRTKDTE